MLTASWWVASPEFDVDTFLSEVNFTPDEIWRRGEQPKWTTSGFRAEFEGEDPFESFLATLREFLLEIKPVIGALRQRGMASTLSFAFTVGGKKIFTRSLAFPPDFLALLAELGIDLQVSAYPSDDD